MQIQMALYDFRFLFFLWKVKMSISQIQFIFVCIVIASSLTASATDMYICTHDTCYITTNSFSITVLRLRTWMFVAGHGNNLYNSLYTWKLHLHFANIHYHFESLLCTLFYKMQLYCILVFWMLVVIAIVKMKQNSVYSFVIITVSEFCVHEWHQL